MQTTLHTVTLKGQPVTPSKIICIGRNYHDHITELANEVPDDMVVFLKPNSAITEMLHSRHEEPLHYETELCFMVQDKRFTAVALGLDLTKRQLQSALKEKGLPWERAKAFDGSALFTDFIPLPMAQVDNDASLQFELSIDDRVVQQGDSRLMMFQPETILRQVQSFMSLNDGDIVMTGTPAGVGQICMKSTFDVRLFFRQELLLQHSWQAL